MNLENSDAIKAQKLINTLERRIAAGLNTTICRLEQIGWFQPTKAAKDAFTEFYYDTTGTKHDPTLFLACHNFSKTRGKSPYYYLYKHDGISSTHAVFTTSVVHSTRELRYTLDSFDLTNPIAIDVHYHLIKEMLTLHNDPNAIRLHKEGHSDTDITTIMNI